MAEEKETKTKRKYSQKPKVKKPDPIPEAKPEKLDVLTIDEGIEKAVGEKKDLGVITTSDLPAPQRIKSKPHDPLDDIMITTADFKPRKFRDMKKL